MAGETHPKSLRRAQAALLVLLAASAAVLWAGPRGLEARAKAAALTAADAGAKIPWELDADMGIQAAAAMNVAGLLLLLVTARWWLRGWRAGPVEAVSGGGGAMPGRVILALLAVALAGTALRLPLASKSLWWDELWAIRQCSHGSWKADEKAGEEGAMRFSPTSWKRCAFYYQKPTNHVPMSLLQKASLECWRWLTGAPGHEFSDLAARVPALGLSGAAIFLTGWLLWAWGAGIWGALGGAALLAAHPMAIRYGVDARGYALVMPLALSALAAGTLMVRRGGRDTAGWIWLGLNQCVWLWAFPHGAMDVLVMTCVLAVLLGLAQANAADRVTVWLRLGVAHVLSGMLFMQLFLPNVLQARHWAGQEGQGHLLDWAIIRDTVARVLTGVRWREPALGTDLGAGLPDLVSLWGGWGAGLAVLGGAGLLLLVNVTRTCLRGERASWLLAGMLVSGLGFAVAAWLVGTYYYSRFAIALVPVVVVGLALGWRRAGGWERVFQAGVLGVLLATAAGGGKILMGRPIEPVRDVAEWLEAAGGEEAVVLGYGHGREALAVLAPRLVPVDDAGQLERELAKAGEEKRTAHLVVGHLNFNRVMLPSGFAVIEDAERFREVARFEGIEADNHYRIYRAENGGE